MGTKTVSDPMSFKNVCDNSPMDIELALIVNTIVSDPNRIEPDLNPFP